MTTSGGEDTRVHEGEVIAGRYRLLGRVGQGADGAVWQAKDRRLDRTVAVKQLFHDSASGAGESSRIRARAIREARVAARLRHPHAIVVHDVFEQDSTPYLVMEYLASRTLTDLIDQLGTLAPDYVAQVGGQLASALAAAHDEGILHRDISPNNVLITADGTAKIADFGVAHARGDGTMTGRGLVVGTPAYLAPEIADGAIADFPSDVFALGATLYTALEGHPPFGTDENQLALLKRVAHGDITPPRTTGPVTDTVLRLLQLDPAARPTMVEAGHLLAGPGTSRPVTAASDLSRPGPAGPIPGPGARRPAATVPEGGRAAPVRKSRARIVLAVTTLLTAVAVAAGIALVGNQSTTGVPTELAAALPSSTAPATTSVGPPTCAARYQVVKSWNTGFQALVTVRNTGQAHITAWTVRWANPAGMSVDDLWDGRLTETGAASAIANADWNAALKPGESTTFGFTALARGGNRGAPVIDCRPAA